MSDEIRPFRVEIPQSDLDHLHERLAGARWHSAQVQEATFRSGAFLKVALLNLGSRCSVRVPWPPGLPRARRA
jgi:hypothetical protein